MSRVPDPGVGAGPLALLPVSGVKIHGLDFADGYIAHVPMSLWLRPALQKLL